MSRVIMLRSQAGSPDGKTVKGYNKGQEYDLPESLFTVFVNDIKCAKPIQEERTVEVKQEQAAPENKMVSTSSSNKSTRKAERPVGKEAAEEFVRGASK